MTNSNDPEQIRREIEATRRDLSRNVDALTDQVTPGNMARREVNRVGESLRGLKDRVMGGDDDYGSSYGTRDAMADRRDELMGRAGDTKDQLLDQAGELRDQAAARLSDAQGAVQGAPAAARRQTRGNPLGAGLVAFGIGALLGGLMPSTAKEREASVALKEKAQPLVEEAKGVAQEAVENLKPQAQATVDAVKSHAADSAEAVKAEGQDAAQTVKASAQDSAEQVKSSAQDAKDEVQATREG
ncbi:MAG: DUF3618 domain-containing protein [Austwickia sp.]|jgi:hypothetical protein|nr:MAG: DUF3618 domain-containing protein [Austwickia sp.]